MNQHPGRQHTRETVMIRKILTTGFLGLFGIVIVGATVFGAVGMVKSVEAKPAQSVKSEQGPVTVEFTASHMPETYRMTFNTRAEAEQFVKVKQMSGYTTTIR